MPHVEIGPWAKSFPATSWGQTGQEFLETAPRLSRFATPLLTLDAAALAHNVALMAGWLDTHGLEIAPHGKTTMAPQLWRQLVDSGAWGITLATGWQAQVARAHGIRRIVLANELIDPVVLAWLGQELADPAFEFISWVDSVEAVDAMTASLTRTARPVDVLVELGAPGGRTGARGIDAALRVAAAVEASPALRLVGAGGYEGSYGRDRTSESIAAVSAYLDDLAELAQRLAVEAPPIVSAGGSAWFDLVAQRLTGRGSRVILRSGAYQIHDAGFYAGITPLQQLRPAMHGWSRVLSTPEPGLALLDGGKRDFPWDEGMPTTRYGAVSKLNDQHAFLPTSEARVGEVLRLGLSHPCTALDKWRLIPMVADADEADPLVVDLVRTYF